MQNVDYRNFSSVDGLTAHGDGEGEEEISVPGQKSSNHTGS